MKLINNTVPSIGYLLAAGVFFLSATAAAQLDITSTTDADVLANTLLGGNGITITSAAIEGGNGAAGTYINGPLGLKDGIVLSTGSVADLLPPNSSSETTTAFDLPGDPIFER